LLLYIAIHGYFIMYTILVVKGSEHGYLIFRLLRDLVIILYKYIMMPLIMTQ